MNTDLPLQPLSPQQYALLMEQAKREAVRLRREAVAAFWDDVARWLSSLVNACVRFGSPERPPRSSPQTTAPP